MIARGLGVALLLLVAHPGISADMHASHFRVVSTATKPTPQAIAADLETTWRTFHDVFAVDPPSVEVVITVTSGGGSSADAGTEAPAGGLSHRIAWSMAEGEPLDGQRFSDLSHEIAHIYFLEYMHEGGLHQSNAWLHEAVACHHEKEASRRHRAEWMRDHLDDRIPLATLFTMRNPVKESPLVELTVQLHEKLARGEIGVEELNRQISAFASSHAEDISRTGIRNMTYYAESVTLFEFLLEKEGQTFIREMCQALRHGATMDAIVRKRSPFPKGTPDLEEAWVAWVRTR